MLEFYKDYYTKLLTQIYQSKSPNNIHKIPNLLHKYGKYPQKLHTIYQKLCNEYGINNIKSFKSIQSAILRKKGIIIKAKIWINQTFMNQTINVSMSHNEMTVKHILTRLKNTKYYKSMENPIIIVKCVSCNICHNTDLLFDYNNYDSGRYYENQYNKNIHLTEWFISSLKYEFGIKSPYRCVTELERACNIYRPIFHVYTNNSGLTTYHKYDDMINIQVSFKYALYLSLSSVKMEICNAIYDTYQWSINSENLVITINNNVLTNTNKSVWDNIATYQTVLPDDVVKFEVYVRDDSIVSMSNDPYIFHTRIEYTKQFDLFDIMKVVDRYCIDHLFFDPDINELIVQYCANLSVGKVLDSGYIVARKDVSMYSIKKKVIVHMMKHHSTHEIWSVYEDSKTIVKTYSNTTNMEMIQYDNKPFQLHRHCYNKCFKIKDRIRINPNEPFGEIAFIGETKYVSESIGINYHRKISHGNCGTVKGVRYFNDGCGYFTDMTRMESAIIYDNNGKQTQWSPANVQNISIIFGRKSIILDSNKTHILVNELRINGLGFCKQIKHEIIVRKSMKVKGLIKRICKKSKINGYMLYICW